MKILHVVKKYPRALGGDAVVVANLQKQQQKAGHTVIIVTSNCDEIADGLHIYKVGLRDSSASLDTITLRRVASLLVLFFKMFAILSKERPNVIHTHSVDMAFFVSFAAKWYAVPLVHTFHIVTFYHAGQSIIRRSSELWLVKKAKPRRITAPNSYDVKKLQTAGLKQTVLLPNGVDQAAWKTYGYTEKGKTFVFLAVGRLESQKGYEYLIRAASQLALIQPIEFAVVIVGDGSQKRALRELIEALHMENVVSIVGRKSQSEVRDLFAESDVAVFPALYETTPLTLLEAWAAAVPAIATSVGILRDVPDDFGGAYIVPPKDEHKLMLAMRRCMRDGTLRTAIAAKGSEEVKQYAWPAVAKAAETVYWGVQ